MINCTASPTGMPTSRLPNELQPGGARPPQRHREYRPLHRPPDRDTSRSQKFDLSAPAVDPDSGRNRRKSDSYREQSLHRNPLKPAGDSRSFRADVLGIPRLGQIRYRIARTRPRL
jgi:hypothetical protein